MTAVAAIVLATAAFFMAASPILAQGQGNCHPRGSLIDYLQKEHGEIAVAHAVTQNRNLIELFVSRGGTWSLIVSHPTGISCYISYGQGGWHSEPASSPKPKDAPA